MSELTSCAVVSPAVGLAPQVRPLLQSSRGLPAAGFVEGLMQAAVEHRAVCSRSSMSRVTRGGV